MKRATNLWLSIFAIGVTVTLTAAPASAQQIEGQVLGAGAPIANARVTLFAATSDAPAQLSQTQSGPDGHFTLPSTRVPGGEVILYLTATGGEPAANRGSGNNPNIALLAVLGPNPPAKLIIKGNALSLKIAAGNVINFVDFQTGGWGAAIQDPLNSGQTPTMANFATLADVLSGCVTRVTADACDKLFAAATPPTSAIPSDTLVAAERIARYPWYKPERLFALLGEFYPVPKGKNLRPVPFMPYLNYAPSAWVLPLKFDGGGYRAGGKAMFDSEGNLWVGDNFTVGWQGTDALWQGHATKFDPNGKPLSPITAGFTGGGMEGGTFGTAVDAKDNAWFTNYGSKAIAVFDKYGKPLTPPEGITFGGRLGLIQGHHRHSRRRRLGPRG